MVEFFCCEPFCILILIEYMLGVVGMGFVEFSDLVMRVYPI